MKIERNLNGICIILVSKLSGNWKKIEWDLNWKWREFGWKLNGNRGGAMNAGALNQAFIASIAIQFQFIFIFYSNSIQILFMELEWNLNGNWMKFEWELKGIESFRTSSKYYSKLQRKVVWVIFSLKVALVCLAIDLSQLLSPARRATTSLLSFKSSSFCLFLITSLTVKIFNEVT